MENTIVTLFIMVMSMFGLFCLMTTIAVILVVRSAYLLKNNVDPILSVVPKKIDAKKIKWAFEKKEQAEADKQIMDRG